MTESQYWHDHVRPKLRPFGFLHRIENAIDKGTPDVAYCLRFADHEPVASGWVELKSLSEMPVRKETPVRVDHLTKEQVRFLENWVACGGRGWLLMRVVSEHFLLSTPLVRKLHEGVLTMVDLRQGAVVHSIQTFPAGRILRELTR